ncbi:serine/threonine-protein kinase [Actinophytocola sediminis]
MSEDSVNRLVAGRYRLRRQLGQGAMGIVWEAYDEFLRRRVAVKEVLRPPGLPDPEADELRERTLREARAIAALSHPNVITLHDVAREGGEPFVVTEYLQARNLAELLYALHPLETAKVAAIGDAVAAGLAAAHQVGITHRDVKPGNVLVCDDGQVKLTDFGIARNVSEKTITRTGIMLGSPCYIAPEVAAGDPVTPAADLWGLGATLFAAVEGAPPYDDGGGVLAIINAVVHGEVPRPSATGPLMDIIAALMVKEPADRISLAEVRNRLHPLLPPPSTPLLSEADLRRLDGSGGDEAPTMVTAPTPPAPPPPQPSAPALAPAPGPLPFTPPRPVRRRRRGAGVSALLTVVAVLLFAGAAGGGFALARVAGGEPILPPAQTRTSTSAPAADPPSNELVEQQGDAATVAGAQGGGYRVQVPVDWVRFVEERRVDDLPSTRVFFVSPDGTRTLTIERFAGYYPDHTIDEYVNDLGGLPNVLYEEISATGIENIADNGHESAAQLTYRTTDHANVLAPGDPRARNQNRVTFANLYPMGADLWVIGVTVPVDQEDSGRAEIFDRLIPTFKVTG